MDLFFHNSKTTETMNKITINGKDFKVKQTIRAMFLYEQITKKAFKIESLMDNYVYFYCLILANNEEVLEWDDFLDALDSDPTIYTQLNEILVENSKIDKLLNSSDEEGKEGELKKN